MKRTRTPTGKINGTGVRFYLKNDKGEWSPLPASEPLTASELNEADIDRLGFPETIEKEKDTMIWLVKIDRYQII